MKSTGIVRAIDELGRVVIPIELRKTLNINVKDSLEFYTDGEGMFLKKYTPGCIFCGNIKVVKIHNGKMICADCSDELRKRE